MKEFEETPYYLENKESTSWSNYSTDRGDGIKTKRRPVK